MQIIEISEPNAENKNELAVGIDFGTTNSVVAVSIEGVPTVIADNYGREIIPSTVNYPNHKISSIKRLFGKNLQEIKSSIALSSITKSMLNDQDESVKLNIDDNLLSPVEVASNVFLYLKVMAEQFLKMQVSKAVVTLPAYYDEAARGEVILAAKLAGLEVLRVLAEPTAAAYGYRLNKQIEGKYLVYDLGGGTFDVSLLNIQRGVLQVIGTGGDNMLGGDDIDQLIADYWKEKYNINEASLITLAKKAKETVTIHNIFNEWDEQAKTQIILDVDELNKIITPLLNKSIQLIKEMLAELNEFDIQAIILVGGSTKLAILQSMLQENFNFKIISDVDPDKIVAIGAALQAENLTYGGNAILIDTVPLSIGIELYGGLVEKIIERNSPLPVIIKKQYTTFADNQTGLEFHILQGEREFAKDCRSIGTFELNGLPLGKAGSVQVELTFAIDLDGVLSISAFEKNVGKAQSITIKPTYGLSKEEVNNILANSYKNVIIDHENRLLQEAILNAQKLISDTRKYFGTGKYYDEPNKYTEIYVGITELLLSIDNNQIADIENYSDKLRTLTEPFILEIMNNLVNTSLKGKNINKV